jgi:hypothetical protein
MKMASGKAIIKNAEPKNHQAKNEYPLILPIMAGNNPKTIASKT